MNFRIIYKTVSEKFQPGTKVLYIPNHANGNIHHIDCERGVVKRTSSDGKTVFVKFNELAWLTEIGDITAQGCYSYNLITKEQYEQRCSSPKYEC